MLTFLENGIIATFYYMQTYILYIACLALFIIHACIEFHEKMYKVVDDERKVV